MFSASNSKFGFLAKILLSPIRFARALATFLPFVYLSGAATEAHETHTCRAGAAWEEPAPPLHIYGNTWFVGTCGLSSILITSKQGHVLIDGGTEKAAPLIEASIRKLGFHLKEVRYILNTHEHFDHVGGIAQLQRDSGATVLSRASAALERGRGDRTDPQFLVAKAFPSVAGVRRLAGDEVLKTGDNVFMAHATPGHTPGSTTWSWDSCEGSSCLHIVYADSFTAISDDIYRYSDEKQHPAVVTDFRASIAKVSALPCDIILTPHPDASRMWSRLGASAQEPLVDADGCRKYAENALKGLESRLANEQALASHD